MNEFYKIYIRFKEHIKNCRDKFRSFDDVNFLLEPFTEIRLQKGYVLDAYKVMDSYYRDGEYFMQLYTCKEGSEIEFVPQLICVKDTLLKRLHMKKCEMKYMPEYDSSMYIAHPIPFVLMNSISCDNLIVPFTEVGIWEALMLRIAYMHLPVFGHGCYKSGKLIFEKDYKLIVDKNRLDFEENKMAMIENGVTIQDNSATVKFTYWNNWEGLVKITLQVQKVNDSIKWGNIGKKDILVPFKSAIRF